MNIDFLQEHTSKVASIRWSQLPPNKKSYYSQEDLQYELIEHVLTKYKDHYDSSKKFNPWCHTVIRNRACSIVTGAWDENFYLNRYTNKSCDTFGIGYEDAENGSFNLILIDRVTPENYLEFMEEIMSEFMQVKVDEIKKICERVEIEFDNNDPDYSLNEALDLVFNRWEEEEFEALPDEMQNHLMDIADAVENDQYEIVSGKKKKSNGKAKVVKEEPKEEVKQEVVEGTKESEPETEELPFKDENIIEADFTFSQDDSKSAEDRPSLPVEAEALAGTYTGETSAKEAGTEEVMANDLDSQNGSILHERIISKLKEQVQELKEQVQELKEQVQELKEQNKELADRLKPRRQNRETFQSRDRKVGPGSRKPDGAVAAVWRLFDEGRGITTIPDMREALRKEGVDIAEATMKGQLAIAKKQYGLTSGGRGPRAGKLSKKIEELFDEGQGITKVSEMIEALLQVPDLEFSPATVRVNMSKLRTKYGLTRSEKSA